MDVRSPSVYAEENPEGSPNALEGMPCILRRVNDTSRRDNIGHAIGLDVSLSFHNQEPFIRVGMRMRRSLLLPVDGDAEDDT